MLAEEKPRKKKKVRTVDIWVVECTKHTCDPGIFYYKGKLPERCPFDHLLDQNTAKPKRLNYEDSEALDIEKGGCVSPRPTWNKGRQLEIRKRSTSVGGTIYCQICKEKIEVNVEGKEEWESRSGNLHETVPHTDHYSSPNRGGGDWIQRKRELEKSKGFFEKSLGEQKYLKKEAFNASPLRVAHMMCNCSREKNNK
ncbi:hypothetical protein ACO0LO_04380 [Undibacterium sp. TJN25]|uniref:hypothetical protein n=1 Tax=Undibacterium sp. TJN25 TaxID=3413056 RepID=UPI003BF2C2F3